MNIKKNKIKSSFVLLCVRYFVLYSVILALIYFCFSYYTGNKLNNAFVSIDDIIQYDEQLATDDFAGIPSKISKNCSLIVFDEEGKRLYSSSKEIGDDITFDLTRFINDYMDDSWYSVSESINADDEKIYIIMLKNHDDMGNEVVSSSCILDKDYNIIRGNLFSDRSQLSEDEFNMVKGSYSKNKVTEKYEYETIDGEKRILVSECPILSDEEYYRLIEKSDMLWAFAVPIVFMVILLQAFLFAKKIKQSISHINRAIDSYQHNEKFEVDKSKIPCEFHSIVDNFNSLLGWLNNLQKEKDNIYKENRQMIADISHDLKTPLTVIQGYSKALNEGRVPEDKKEKYLETIYDKSVLSTELIDSLFDCVKMEHPDYKLNLTEVDLSEYIKEILAEKYNEIEESGFDVEVDIPEHKIPFNIDKKLFRRMIENLLGNSLQYNPKGTTIYVALKEEKNDIVLTVADNGVGIPSEIRENIFKPFVTSNNARSSGKGTGLGLTIAKKITELHKGTISLCEKPTNPSYKTEFEIRFPLISKK